MDLEAEHLTEGPALAGGERGSVPELAVFVVLVLVCASIAVASFQASEHRQVSATQQLLAADAVKATLASLEEELNSALRSAIVAAMYDVGLAGGSRGEVERLARLYLNQRISLGWRRGSMTIEVPLVDENSLAFEWRPDGGVVAKGYLAAEVRHVMGPAAHGVTLEASPQPRFERLRSVALQLLPQASGAVDLKGLEQELNSLYSPEGLAVSLERGENEVKVAVADVLAAASAYVGSGRGLVRYVATSASLSGGGGSSGGGGGAGGGENQGGGGGGGGGGQASQPSAYVGGRVVERYTGLPVWDVLVTPTMTNSGSGGWLLYFPTSGMTNNDGYWSIRVIANSYGAFPTSWSANFTFSKSGWLGASRNFSSTATYRWPDTVILSPSDVGTVELERLNYGSFTLSLAKNFSYLYVYWDPREQVWKTDTPATNTATVSGDYCAPIDFVVYPEDLQVSVSPSTVAIADPRTGGTGFANASLSASVVGLGPNYLRYPQIWAKGRTGYKEMREWVIQTTTKQ